MKLGLLPYRTKGVGMQDAEENLKSDCEETTRLCRKLRSEDFVICGPYLELFG